MKRTVIISFEVEEGEDADAAAQQVTSALLGRFTDDSGADVAMILGDEGLAEVVGDFNVSVFEPASLVVDLMNAAACLTNEADRLHENDNEEDEDDSEEYGALAQRLHATARRIGGS